MRIKTETDIQGSVGFLNRVFKTLKWPDVKVTAIGFAIETQDQIIEEFKDSNKDLKLNIEVTEEDF